MAIKSLFNKVIEKHKLYRLSSFIYEIYSIYLNVIVKLKFQNKSMYKVNLKNKIINFDTSDFYSKKWFYLFNQKNEVSYENSVTTYLINNLKSNSCFFDLGAHIGYYTCIAASILEEGEVHAFEVDKNCQNYIENNIKINDYKNITINLIAVSDSTDGEFIPDIKSPNNKISIFVEDFKKRFVSSTTLDNYVERHNLKPDFIKIDVEAAEYKVLKGMTKTLILSPLTLLIELHVKTLSKLGYNYIDLLHTLTEYGFEIYELKQFRTHTFEKIKITEKSEFNNDTFLIAEKL